MNHSLKSLIRMHRQAVDYYRRKGRTQTPAIAEKLRDAVKTRRDAIAWRKTQRKIRAVFGTHLTDQDVRELVEHLRPAWALHKLAS